MGRTVAVRRERQETDERKALGERRIGGAGAVGVGGGGSSRGDEGRVERAEDGQPDAWASRLTTEHLWGDHPYGRWGDRKYWERMRDWDQSMVEQWVNRFYQPANSTLFIVGKIPDLDAAEKSVRDYFGTWAPKPGAEVGPILPPEAPSHSADRRVIVFDKPTSTFLVISCFLNSVDTLCKNINIFMLISI